MDTAWAAADITMGLMTIINLPCCALLYGVVNKTLKDYEKQKKEGKNPVFTGSHVGLKEDEISFWK